jgi:HK97 family phage portal protein
VSLFRGLLSKRLTAQTAPLIPSPGQGAGTLAGSVRVNQDTALRNSAVWAALRIRADLISTMPVDVYRLVDGVRVNVKPPPVLVNPGGERVGIEEWLYSTQFDLDRAGNAFGLVTERDALGLPARIDLLPLGDVTVRSRGGTIDYLIGGKATPASEVWHEKQYTVSGLAVGLSPVANAAFTLGAYQSALQFAIEWFSNSAMPAFELKNKEQTVPQEVADIVKMRAEAAMTPGGVFVHGNDWELKPVQSMTAQSAYLDMMRDGVPDIARYFGVPADLIDGAVSGSGVTYANIGQRNTQFLIMHLGPAVRRRETALSGLTAKPRFVKLNRSGLLAMDPATRATTLGAQIKSFQLAPDEARAIEDRAPLTAQQWADLERVNGAARTTPTEAKA